MRLSTPATLLAALLAWTAVPAAAQTQESDPEFDTRVACPAWRGEGPVVAIDAAHHNFHTADGRYRPFAELLRNDGYRVVAGGEPFSRASLADVDVLVVANAGAREAGPETPPLFTEAEQIAVRDWVAAGGALLLIADHAPFGAAAEALAARFGVEMGKGWVLDESGSSGRVSTQLIFSRADGRLGDHPITRGRDAGERVDSVRAFTGQSLTLPDGATALMRLSANAREAPDTEALNAASRAVAAGEGPWHELAAPHSEPAGGRVQGLAMRHGEGRIVVLGEAAMLSAQVVTLPTPDGGERVIRAGMNVPGYDNRQFALNLLRWLSGVLD